MTQELSSERAKSITHSLFKSRGLKLLYLVIRRVIVTMVSFAIKPTEQRERKFLKLHAVSIWNNPPHNPQTATESIGLSVCCRSINPLCSKMSIGVY